MFFEGGFLLVFFAVAVTAGAGVAESSARKATTIRPTNAASAALAL